MKAGPGRHTEAVCMHKGGRKMFTWVSRLMWNQINSKRPYQTQDVGQPMTQGGKYTRLKSNQAY